MVEQPLARTPEPPYWAVIFTSRRAPVDDVGYDVAAAAMAALAARQPGFLGFDSARGADGVGITVSYWNSEEALLAWKHVAAHATAQRSGRERREYKLTTDERAAASAFNGRGPWWNAGASHMNEAYPKRYFDHLGLVSLFDEVRRQRPNAT